jgi:hypothetical protein
MLSAGRGSAQVVPRLHEARLQVDSLIFEGVHQGVLVTLMSVGSHYGGVDFDAIG